MRYEVHPQIEPADTEPVEWFWHRRSGNGQITSNGETYTRHEDAVRAIRGDVEDTADMLGIPEKTFHRLYAHELVYFDVTGCEVLMGEACPVYEEKPLYPQVDVPEPSNG